jgi:anti-sigma B factor antagonist
MERAVDDQPADAGPWLMIYADHDGPDVDVRIWGDLDLASAGYLRRELERIAATVLPGGLVVVDASALSFVDSAGLMVLDEGRQAIRRGGARFRLVASEALERLLELCGLTDLLVDG